MKKIISLLMALIFVFSMATPSFAAVAANEAVVAQASETYDEDGVAGPNDLLGRVVEIVNKIWVRIVDFFKSLFGFGFKPGTYNVTYYTDSTKTEILYVRPTVEGQEIEDVAIPTKIGYTFKSWEPALPKVMPAEDIEVYATWSIKTVTIKFETGVEDIKVPDIKTTYGSIVNLPEIEDYDSYTLDCWIYRMTGDKVDMPNGKIEALEDTTFVAGWTVKATTITLNPNGGYWKNNPANVAPYYISNPVGTSITMPSDPKREGYKFEGWDGVLPDKQPADNITFTAIWSPIDIKTTWVADGKTLDTQTTKCGEKLSPRKAPVPPAGYKFVGWKSSVDGNVYNSFPISTPTKDTIFTAQFDAIAYNYNFIGADGTILKSGSEFCGETIDVPAAPAKVGHTFIGWADNTGTIKIGPAVKTATMQAGDAVYTAKYSANVHTITWDANGGKINGKNSFETEVAYGSAIATPADPVWTGYVFDGWVGADGKGVPAKMGDADLTFTAKWSPAGDTPYTVETYVMDTKGQYVKTTETKLGVTGDTAEVIPEEKLGFTFNAASSVTSKVIAANGSTVLKLYYNRNKYNVIINDVTKQYYFEEVFQAPAAVEKEGHTFTNWKGSDEKTYAAGANVTVPAFDGFTLTPEFSVNSYTVIFKVNDSVYQTLTFKYGDPIILPADPLMADMVFEGWSPELPATMPASNLTVFANFTKATIHKVTFHANSKGHFEVKDTAGNLIETVQTTSFNVKRGDKISCPDAPKCKPGYRFIGWATYSEGGYTEDSVLFKDINDAPKMTYSQDIFFYAVYVTPTCKITYILDGVELTDKTTTVETGSKVNPALVTPKEKLGYNFNDGWKLLTVNGKEVERDDKGNLKGDYATYYSDSGEWTTRDTDETVVYVGEYKPNKHNVVFHATNNAYWFKLDTNNEATTEKEYSKTVETEYNSVIDVPAAPVVPYGMKFIGWTNDLETQKLVNITTLTDNEKEYATDKVYHYYAVIVVDVYELKFIEYNNTVTLKKTYNYDEAIDVSGYIKSIPERKGYAVNEEKPFYPAVPASVTRETIADYGKNVGYSISYRTEIYTDSYGNEIPYEVGVLTFVVQYDLLKYKVYFSGCDYETMEIPYGTVLSTKIEDPEAYGRTFLYWYMINEEGHEVKVDLTKLAMPAEKDGITLYAKWSNNPYTIKFVDQDGGVLYDEDGKVIEMFSGVYGDAVKAPKAPVKTGYTFAGWDTKIPATLEKDLIIKATWGSNTYTVKFNTNGGQPAKIDSMVVAFGTQVKLPADPTKTGHTFLGWDYTVGNGEEYFIPVGKATFDMTACDIILTARWQINQYTITFVTGNGTPINPITADYGTPINVKTEWAGHSYTWSPALPETMPDKDMTVTAVWTCKESAHKLYFHPVITPDDPATSKDESYKVTITYVCKENGGEKITVPTEADFLKVGYKVQTGRKIGGWMDKTGAEVTFTAPVNYSLNGSHFYVSKYSLADYTLTFDSNGGSAVPSAKYNYLDHIAEPTEPTYPGYTFAGWYNASGNLVDFETLTMPAADMTLKAKWTPNKYTANWDNEGNITSVKYDFGAVINLPAQPSRTGYTFGGWAGYEAGMTMPIGGITFTAIWNAIPHNATFDPNGGAFDDPEVTGTQPFTKTINYGTAINPPKLAARTGYTFAGWVDKVSKQPMPANMPNKDVVFYAVWVGEEGTPYTLNIHYMNTLGEYGAPVSIPQSGVTGEVVDYTTYETPRGFSVADRSNLTGAIKADGSLVINIYLERNQYTLKKVIGTNITTEKVYYDAALAIPALPEKTDDTVYTGWSWSYTLDGENYTDKPARMPASDVTVTAVTTARLYTVSFMSAGSAYTPKQYEYNTVIDLATLGIPTATGKTFKYWSLEDGGSKITTLTVTEDNMKIWAVWEPIEYNASFYDETGTALIHTETIPFGTTITYTPPAKDGYTFAGWVIDGKDSITSTMPAHDVKLIARWTVNP